VVKREKFDKQSPLVFHICLFRLLIQNESKITLFSIFLWFCTKSEIILEQVSTTYGALATLGTPSNFQWHAEAPSFTYRFCYDSQRRYTDLDLHENTYAVGTLSDLKRRTIIAKDCRSLCWSI